MPNVSEADYKLVQELRAQKEKVALKAKEKKEREENLKKFAKYEPKHNKAKALELFNACDTLKFIKVFEPDSGPLPGIILDARVEVYQRGEKKGKEKGPVIDVLLQSGEVTEYEPADIIAVGSKVSFPARL